jgi:hypothetical protein
MGHSYDRLDMKSPPQTLRMRSQRGRLLTAAARQGLALCLALAVSGCRCEDQSVPTVEPERLHKLKGPAMRFASKLAKIQSELASPANLVEEPCPDEEELKLQLDGGYGRMLLVDYEYLRRFAQPELDPYAGENRRWKRLTAPMVLAIEPPQPMQNIKDVTNTLYQMQKVQKGYQHLAVVRTTRRELPRVDAGGFHAGRLEGWLVVFELESGRRLCQAGLWAQSSSEVAGLEGQSRDLAVWRDFERQIDKTLNEAARRLSRRLLLRSE